MSAVRARAARVLGSLTPSLVVVRADIVAAGVVVFAGAVVADLAAVPPRCVVASSVGAVVAVLAAALPRRVVASSAASLVLILPSSRASMLCRLVASCFCFVSSFIPTPVVRRGFCRGRGRRFAPVVVSGSAPSPSLSPMCTLPRCSPSNSSGCAEPNLWAWGVLVLLPPPSSKCRRRTRCLGRRTRGRRAQPSSSCSRGFQRDVSRSKQM